MFILEIGLVCPPLCKIGLTVMVVSNHIVHSWSDNV